jgi:hypothetical protein
MAKFKTSQARRLLHVFGREIIESEEAISRAFSDLCEYSAFSKPASSNIHRSVKAILSEAAQISLIFFPTRKGQGQERAEFLKAELAVSPDSPLSNRILRNHLAHLDERLDFWAMNSSKQTFGRAMLGSREDALHIGLQNEDILGLFDTRTYVFSFLDDDISIDDLVGEVRAVSHRVRKKLRALPWHEVEN